MERDRGAGDVAGAGPHEPDASSGVRGYRVRGRVQGVGFRWWTRRTASELGLTGSVRNLSDGSVEVIAAGDGRTLDDLESALATGPVTARVDAVERFEVTGEVGGDDFSVDFVR